MSNYEPSLEILEVEYSCSPGGIDTFEVYDKTNNSAHPIYETTVLTEAVQFCYNLGMDFVVRTLAEYHDREFAYEG
jgi:hypothetical protein